MKSRNTYSAHLAFMICMIALSIFSTAADDQVLPQTRKYGEKNGLRVVLLNDLFLDEGFLKTLK